jgi:hypothetical protein
MKESNMSTITNTLNPAGADASQLIDIPAIGRHVQMLCTMARRAIEVGLAPRDSVLVLSGFRADDTDPRNYHFRVDQAAEMIDVAHRLATFGWNIYSPLALMNPATINSNGKGTLADVVTVLGFVVDSDADKEGKQPAQCPVDAPYIVESSTGNFQHYLLLDRALPPAEAKLFGNALKRMTKADCISDFCHVWRIGGAINIPNSAKLKRGRSPVPQAVSVRKPWDGVTFTNVEALRTVLDAYWQDEPPYDPNSPQARTDSEHDNDPTKVRDLIRRIRDKGFLDAGPDARENYVHCLKALSHAFGDVEGFAIAKEYVFWRGVRGVNEGVPADEAEMAARWKDCKSMRTKKPYTLGSLKRELENVYGWPQKEMYTERDKTAASMFNLGTSKTVQELAAQVGAGLSPEVLASAPKPSSSFCGEPEQKITIDDFIAFLPSHSYIFIPTREMWPAAGVDAKLPPMPLFDSDGKPVIDEKTGEQKKVQPSKWLDWFHHVDQATWAPGEPLEVRDRLIAEGGWFDQPGASTFNLYKPPEVFGRPGDVSMWTKHIQDLYGDAEADHIIKWLAHRVQKPAEKINHALVRRARCPEGS